MTKTASKTSKSLLSGEQMPITAWWEAVPIRKSDKQKKENASSSRTERTQPLSIGTKRKRDVDAIDVTKEGPITKKNRTKGKDVLVDSRTRNRASSSSVAGPGRSRPRGAGTVESEELSTLRGLLDGTSHLTGQADLNLEEITDFAADSTPASRKQRSSNAFRTPAVSGLPTPLSRPRPLRMVEVSTDTPFHSPSLTSQRINRKATEKISDHPMRIAFPTPESIARPKDNRRSIKGSSPEEVPDSDAENSVSSPVLAIFPEASRLVRPIDSNNSRRKDVEHNPFAPISQSWVPSSQSQDLFPRATPMAVPPRQVVNNKTVTSNPALLVNSDFGGSRHRKASRQVEEIPSSQSQYLTLKPPLKSQTHSPEEIPSSQSQFLLPYLTSPRRKQWTQAVQPSIESTSILEAERRHDDLLPSSQSQAEQEVPIWRRPVRADMGSPAIETLNRHKAGMSVDVRDSLLGTPVRAKQGRRNSSPERTSPLRISESLPPSSFGSYDASQSAASQSDQPTLLRDFMGMFNGDRRFSSPLQSATSHGTPAVDASVLDLSSKTVPPGSQFSREPQSSMTEADSWDPNATVQADDDAVQFTTQSSVTEPDDEMTVGGQLLGGPDSVSKSKTSQYRSWDSTQSSATEPDSEDEFRSNPSVSNMRDEPLSIPVGLSLPSSTLSEFESLPSVVKDFFDMFKGDGRWRGYFVYTIDQSIASLELLS